MTYPASVVVVIPNYNHAKFLRDRISSVLSQTHPIKKIIILDDASTDDSLLIISSFNDSRIEYVFNSTNSGSVFKQWEKGLSLIESDSLVWIAESDDVSDISFLQEVLKAFNDPEVVMAYSRSIDIDENGTATALSYQHLDWKNYSFIKNGMQEITEHLFKQCTIPNVSAVIFKKKIVDSSFFEHNYFLCGDWYFYIKLLNKGKIVYLNTPLNFHRYHKETVRNKSLRNLDVLRERLSIVNYIFNTTNLSYYKYISSMAFQVELFLNETTIVNLMGSLGKSLFLKIKPYGNLFIFVAICLFIKRIIKRFSFL